MSDHCRISIEVVPFVPSQMSILWVVVLCPYFSLHFWETPRVDGVIHLEVSNPTITSGGVMRLKMAWVHQLHWHERGAWLGMF